MKNISLTIALLILNSVTHASQNQQPEIRLNSAADYGDPREKNSDKQRTESRTLKPATRSVIPADFLNQD